MLQTIETAHRRSFCSRAGLVLGMRTMLPLLPGMSFFAIAAGALSAQRGLTLTEFCLMQGYVFAGLSQLIVLSGWQENWAPSALLGIMAVTLTVNSRLILMGAALRPWLAEEPFWRRAINLVLFTDANWIAGMRYREQGGNDTGQLLGGALTLWVSWMAVGLAGYFAGSLLTDPRRYGLDLLTPVFFVTMIAPLWKGRRQTLGWGAAAVVSFVVHRLQPGYAYIVAGAFAGMLVGALIGDGEPDRSRTP